MTDPTTTDETSADLRVRQLRPADVPGLMALFARCYGDAYGNRLFYDAAALAAAVRDGTLRGVVAVAADGTLLGHTAVTIRHAGARVCETGNTVVDPDARGRGLLRRLGTGLRERVLGDGFFGYVHYPTTAHPIMQRVSVSGGGREVGVMLGYVAEAAADRATSATPGRLAATVAYQSFRALPHRTVRVPARYRTLLGELYTDLALDRSLETATAPLADAPSRVVQSWQPRRGLLHLFVERGGRDLADAVAAAMTAHGPAVTQLDMALDEPALDGALQVLVPLQFVFSALLPDFARTDVLRLQALRDPTPEVMHPDLVNDRARWLCARIRDEAGAA